MTFIVACGESDPGEFARSGSKRISNGVWIFQTSASTFSIADEDGMGLIMGNVIKAKVTEGYLWVELSGANARRAPEYKWAKLKLASGALKELQTPPDGLLKVAKFYKRL